MIISALALLGVVALVWVVRAELEDIRLFRRYAFLKEYVHIIVRSLEQTGKLTRIDSAEKKQIATIKVEDYAKELGVELLEGECDSLIEAAVQVMNENKEE